MRVLDPTVTAAPPTPSRRARARERKQANRLVGILYALFPLLVASGVLFVLVVIGGKALQGYQMKQEAMAVQQRIDQLRAENRRLGEQLDYYKSDEYIEKAAREYLGLVRPNDVPVVIVSPDQGSQVPVPTPTRTPVPTADKQVPTWQRWLSVFVDQDQ